MKNKNYNLQIKTVVSGFNSVFLQFSNPCVNQKGDFARGVTGNLKFTIEKKQQCVFTVFGLK